MNPVSRTTLQSRYNRQQRQHRTLEQDRPVEVPCRIIKVYDSELEDREDFPDLVQERIASRPGEIWSLVEISNQMRVLLPFEEAPDQIYSLYGNSVALEGASAKVRYSNYNLEAGVIILTKYSQDRVINLKEASFAADIGGIIGIGS